MTIGVLSILRASLVFATVAAVACPADAQVVCLGASNTAGKGVSQQEAYPAQLEIMLRARHGGNDERHGAASWRDANISQIVERLRARQVAVIMLENQLIRAIRTQGYGLDAQHLTAEGYRLLAAQLLPQVAPALGLPPK